MNVITGLYSLEALFRPVSWFLQLFMKHSNLCRPFQWHQVLSYILRQVEFIRMKGCISQVVGGIKSTLGNPHFQLVLSHEAACLDAPFPTLSCVYVWKKYQIKEYRYQWLFTQQLGWNLPPSSIVHGWQRSNRGHPDHCWLVQGRAPNLSGASQPLLRSFRNRTERNITLEYRTQVLLAAMF